MFTRTVTDRFSVIGDQVATGRVLDVGCVDAWPAKEGSRERIRRKPDALFRRLVEINPQTVGLDIDADGVALLCEQGFVVHCADAETADLGQTFDAIVAGDIIEHLENPGLFLRNMRRHLAAGGRLMLTTPNPFYAGQSWKIWKYGIPQVHEDHTCWLDPVTLCQLLTRTGFRIVEVVWTQPKRGWWKRWKSLFRSYFAHSFLVVAEANEDGDAISGPLLDAA